MQVACFVGFELSGLVEEMESFDEERANRGHQ